VNFGEVILVIQKEFMPLENSSYFYKVLSEYSSENDKFESSLYIQ